MQLIVVNIGKYASDTKNEVGWGHFLWIINMRENTPLRNISSVFNELNCYQSYLAFLSNWDFQINFSNKTLFNISLIIWYSVLWKPLHVNWTVEYYYLPIIKLKEFLRNMHIFFFFFKY